MMIVVFAAIWASAKPVQAFLACNGAVFAVRVDGKWRSPGHDSTLTFPKAPIKPSLVGGGMGLLVSGNFSVQKSNRYGWRFEVPMSSGVVLEWGAKARDHLLHNVTARQLSKYKRMASRFLSKNQFRLKEEKLTECVEATRGDLTGDGRRETIVTLEAVDKVGTPFGFALYQDAKGRVSRLLCRPEGHFQVVCTADFIGDGSLQTVLAGSDESGDVAQLWTFKPHPKCLMETKTPARPRDSWPSYVD